MRLLLLIPLLLIVGCQSNPITGPSTDLRESGKKFFTAYVNGKESPSGPQCLFLSESLLQELESRPGDYCKEEEIPEEPFPPQFIKTSITIVDQSKTDAELALAVCARAPQGWVAQPPFFFEMSKKRGVWLADSFPEPLLEAPSKKQEAAGKKAMSKIASIPLCQDSRNWGSDQWFSYKNI